MRRWCYLWAEAVNLDSASSVLPLDENGDDVAVRFGGDIVPPDGL
jgi:hypothetical protein